MSLYEDVGGFDRILAVCRRWHELCLDDPLAQHPFSHGMHPQHDERLAAYLAEAVGGPALYTAGYGDESSMRRLHAGQGSDADMEEACLRLFDQALSDVGVTGDAAQCVSAYFRAAAFGFRQYADSADLVPDNLDVNHA
ncbi:oxidoreductase [Saccharomonospora sp. CUA-673]|uniref:globin domain-containing protein n=1 Tax=Saccharomonospora sp. CUA-673 TaxID=1904969 RepID=UPI00096A594E|nr:oxidoreductase [Saccharomonospora sp. CUA-673]